jgi:hypothetical protein
MILGQNNGLFIILQYFRDEFIPVPRENKVPSFSSALSASASPGVPDPSASASPGVRRPAPPAGPPPDRLPRGIHPGARELAMPPEGGARGEDGCKDQGHPPATGEQEEAAPPSSPPFPSPEISSEVCYAALSFFDLRSSKRNWEPELYRASTICRRLRTSSSRRRRSIPWRASRRTP